MYNNSFLWNVQGYYRNKLKLLQFMGEKHAEKENLMK